MNETTKSEVGRLHELLNFRKREKEESNKDNQKIKEQVQASFEVNAELEANLDSLNEKYELLKSENSDLAQSRGHYKAQADRNALGLSDKNKEMIDRIEELGRVKQEYEERLKNVSNMETDLFNRLSIQH